MNINEIITTLESADNLPAINSALTSLFDILLNNSNLDQDELSKIARLRARITIELTA